MQTFVKMFLRFDKKKIFGMLQLKQNRDDRGRPRAAGLRPRLPILRITLSEARSRLDRRRFSRPNTHFSAFFKTFKKIIFSQANLQTFASFFLQQTAARGAGPTNGPDQNFAKKKIEKFLKICRKFAASCKVLQNFAIF